MVTKNDRFCINKSLSVNTAWYVGFTELVLSSHGVEQKKIFNPSDRNIFGQEVCFVPAFIFNFAQNFTSQEFSRELKDIGL